MAILDIDTLKERCRLIHGDKYEYDWSTFVNTRKKMRIICHEVDPITGREHGEFWMDLHAHLAKNKPQACPRCSGTHRWTLDEFIERANIIHNNKYDYSEFEYKRANTPSVIICHEKDENGVEHGRFLQQPVNHICQRQGCPKCRPKRISDSKMMTPQEVVEKAKVVHGDRYTYTTDFEYTGNKCQMPIVCKEHGLFYQRVNDHLSGRGCPECGRTFVQEKLLFEEVQKRYPDAERQHKEEYLHSATSYQTIDIYIPSLKIGIEYQGAQHFGDTTIFARGKKLEENKERDRRKYNKCLEHGIKIFYFSKEPKRLIPDDYIDTVYTEYEDLFSAISLYVNNMG